MFTSFAHSMCWKRLRLVDLSTTFWHLDHLGLLVFLHKELIRCSGSCPTPEWSGCAHENLGGPSPKEQDCWLPAYQRHPIWCLYWDSLSALARNQSQTPDSPFVSFAAAASGGLCPKEACAPAVEGPHAQVPNTINSDYHQLFVIGYGSIPIFSNNVHCYNGS